jgi:hypothetical protein
VALNAARKKKERKKKTLGVQLLIAALPKEP